MEELRVNFGMFEMETAAKIIIEYCLKENKLVAIHIDDFIEDYGKEDDAVTGFVELISYGWLDRCSDYGGSHGCFIPSDGFIERVKGFVPQEWRGTQGEKWEKYLSAILSVI